MLEAQTPMDIRKYDAKLVGPFTTRQLVCFVGGAVLSYGCYKLFGNILGNTTFYVSCVVALPFLVCGWIKPYGMPFERFFQSAFVSTVLAPKHRKYKTKNYYLQATAEIRKMSAADYKKRKQKEKKLAKLKSKYIAYK